MIALSLLPIFQCKLKVLVVDLSGYLRFVIELVMKIESLVGVLGVLGFQFCLCLQLFLVELRSVAC